MSKRETGSGTYRPKNVSVSNRSVFPMDPDPQHSTLGIRVKARWPVRQTWACPWPCWWSWSAVWPWWCTGGTRCSPTCTCTQALNTPTHQCCGTIGNDLLWFWFRLWKSSGSVSSPYLSVFQQTNILAFLIIEAAMFPRKMSSHFWFFDFFGFCITLYVRPGSRTESGTGTECITVPFPVPLRQKVTVPTVPVSVPQHCYT